jgi:2-polyprenyl-6-methoxyphenol hydroxylase-like FAD-dependent oxidoreductase
MARRAVVIGGSMGGLFAAAFLQRIGWEAHIYERTADDLASRGAGLGTHEVLLEGLRALGIDTGERLGVLIGLASMRPCGRSRSIFTPDATSPAGGRRAAQWSRNSTRAPRRRAIC